MEPSSTLKQGLFGQYDPAVFHRSRAAFLRELPDLLKSHCGKWVAFHGDNRVGFSHSKAKLREQCLNQQLALDEVFLTIVQPQFVTSET